MKIFLSHNHYFHGCGPIGHILLIKLLAKTDDTSETTISTVDFCEVNISTTDHSSSSMIDISEPAIRESIPLVVSQDLHIQGTKATQSRCFICQSNTGRKGLPWPAIQQAWFEKRCYIPKTNRTCVEHLTSSHTFTDDALRMIEDLKQDIFVKPPDFGLWLNAISDLPKSTPYNVEDDGIDAEKYRMFFGISKDDFDDLLQYLKGTMTLFFLI